MDYLDLFLDISFSFSLQKLIQWNLVTINYNTCASICMHHNAYYTPLLIQTSSWGCCEVVRYIAKWSADPNDGPFTSIILTKAIRDTNNVHSPLFAQPLAYGGSG